MNRTEPNPAQETVKRAYSPYLDALAKLRKATVSFVMSVCLSVRIEQLCSQWMDFPEICYLRIYWNVWRKFVSLSLTRITDILHDTLCAFVIISRWILLRIRNVTDKFLRVLEEIRLTLMETSRQSSSVQITMDQTQPDNISTICYRDKNEASGTRAIKSRIAVAKRHSETGSFIRRQIGLKFKEDTSEVLYLEQSFVWCWNLGTSEDRSGVPGKFRNVFLEKDGEDQLDRSCE